MKPIKSHTFRGKRYKIDHVRFLKDADGDCDHPIVKSKKIRIVKNKSVSPKKRLINSIHEAIHACIWDLAEDTVTETSEDIGSFLWRLGYRKVEGL